MAATHLDYMDLANNKFSDTDPDQEADSLIQLIERKIKFAPADEPRNAAELARMKALFSFSL